MSKKLFTGLAPFLAIAAFVAMPTAAQAAPHFFKGGALAAETEKIPVVSWGKLTLSPNPAVAAITTCENIAGGFVENPTGGGAGIGQTSRFATYNCTNAECPAGEVEIAPGVKVEKEFEVVSNPNHLPWPSSLEEPEAGVIRTNSTNVEVKLACMAHGFSRNAAGEGNPSLGTKGAGESEQFVLPSGGPPTVTCVTDATHQQKPKNIKGSNGGPNQSKVEFDAGAGALNCAGGAFEGDTKETLKIMGYKNSELITTK
jgi:hypothetical protein